MKIIPVTWRQFKWQEEICYHRKKFPFTGKNSCIRNKAQEKLYREDPGEGVPAKRMCQKMNNNFFYKAASWFKNDILAIQK